MKPEYGSDSVRNGLGGLANTAAGGRPLAEVFGPVLSLLAPADRASLRATCGPLRGLANSASGRLSVSASPGFQTLASSQLLKRFPRASAMDFTFSSSQEIKAATMFLLTCPPDQSAQLASLALTENRNAAQQLYQQQQAYGGASSGYGHESRWPGYNSGSRSPPQTFDFTETLLASVVGCSTVRALTVDKTVLLDTEAATLARLTSLEELRLETNSSAQPLRRPLLQMVMSALPQLRILKLSYIRDTTAEMVLSLARLPHLKSLTFQYAYWGESGAGERIMAAISKHQKQLEELCLHECCVSDDMLRLITTISTLRRLVVQDEDAPEESCPSNKGLARITQLARLERLELFGEELQLDGELLGLLARLPSLRYLAMAGLDSLAAEGCDSPLAALGMDDLDAEVEEMELSSGPGDDEETDTSTSDVSGGGTEVTSRPAHALNRTSVTSAARAGARAGARGSNQQPPTPGADRGPHQAGQRASGGPGAPLQVLRCLQTLRLYGPSSLGVSPAPLALMLPQPHLHHLKLSACASAANLRALTAAKLPALRKLIVSHTAVPHLYPPAGTAPPAPGCGVSLLGFHPEVSAGLSSLHVLRIKDLPGLMDCHLVDLASALVGLPALQELKLRALGMVSDAGLAALEAVTQLRRLKLYALGDGVTEHGVASLVAALPAMEEVKVKDCRRIGYTLRSTIAACRAAASATGSMPAVRLGPQECEGARAVQTGSVLCA
ncbi:hypothetical protein HYH03_007515 [Edaphochlamys debaryana]|uniref:Uncharacterized protein n=1 Tax=Edaphochlamys debaryana TaxID=47281 RepID=A0A835Y1Z9_9CHLO|nr:hypothetical protein HYH03_007515 [Edaphochlamys debaryana]|eukprot:KAG2494463.1 hypothetical protein HYH03_007515 [Edaphochlamys debaryana]